MVKWVLHDLSELAVFAEQFRSYCEKVQLDESKIFELDLSLEELLVNSFTHGYSETNKGTVTVQAEDLGTEIKISVNDKAPSFDLFRDAPAPRLGGKDPEPQPEDEVKEATKEKDKEGGKEGGLGIHLVKSLNDKVEYYGSQDGNIVVIIKSKS